MKPMFRKSPKWAFAANKLTEASQIVEARGDYKKAYQLFTEVIADPNALKADKAQAHFRIFALHLNNQNRNFSSKEAKEHYENALALGYPPNTKVNVDELNINIFHEQARAFFAQGRYELAIKAYRREIEAIRKQQKTDKDPDPRLIAHEANVLCSMGECQRDQLKQLDAAERSFREATLRVETIWSMKVNLFDNDTVQRAHLLWAEFLIEQGRFDEGHTVLKSLTQSPLELNAWQRGYAYFKIGELGRCGHLPFNQQEIENAYEKASQLGITPAKDFQQLYLAECSREAGDLDKAIGFLNQVKESPDMSCRIQALRWLGSIYISKNKMDMGIKYNEECVKCYLTHKDHMSKGETPRSAVAAAAHNAAIYLSNTDPDASQKRFDYYTLACALDTFPVSHCNLGSIYAFGEARFRNLTKAKTHFEVAAKQWLEARRGLAIVLINYDETRNTEEGIRLLEELAKKDPSAWNDLGNYYSFGRVASGVEKSSKVDVLATFKPNLQKAKECYEKAVAGGDEYAKFGLVQLLLGDEKEGEIKDRLDKAERYCLELLKSTTLPETAISLINEKLAFIYCQRLRFSGRPEEVEYYARKTLKYFGETQQGANEAIFITSDTKLDEDEIQRIRDLKIENHHYGVALNQQIVATVRDNELTPQTRIEKLVNEFESLVTARDLKSVAPVNIATMMFNLGRLTERCVTDRAFHSGMLPRILPGFEHIKKVRAAVNFEVRAIVDCIEGISKLHLHAGVQEHRELVQAFYGDAVKKLKELTLQDKVRLIFSATRLDPRLSIFKTDVSRWFESVSFLSSPGAGIMFKATPQAIEAFGSLKGAELPCLIESALKDCSEGDDQALANLAHSLKLFDTADFDYRKLEGFDRFIGLLQTRFSERDEKQEGEGYLISLHQVYLALSYFHQKYPEMGIQERHLKTWYGDLKTMKHSETVSPFQSEVVRFIRPYCDSVEEEKPVDLSPVDAVVRIHGKEHYLQVDGSVHYLHGKAGQVPVLNLATRFRNTYLEQVTGQAPVCVSCYEWPKGSDEEKRKFFLEKKKIELKPEDKWTDVSSAGLFC